MPTPFLKKIAAKTGKSIDEIESIWDRAKHAVSSEGKTPNMHSYWAIVTSLTKKWSGYHESYSLSEHILIDHILNSSIETKIETAVKRILGHCKECGPPPSSFIEDAREMDRIRIESPLGPYIVRAFALRSKTYVRVECPAVTNKGQLWYE